MKKILFLILVAACLVSCTESYDMSYEELNDRYRMLDSEYSSLKEHCEELEEELYYHERECVSYDEYDELKRSLEDDYIHRDEVNKDYILEEDVLNFLEAVYDEKGDYIHKDRIEELINHYCW